MAVDALILNVRQIVFFTDQDTLGRNLMNRKHVMMKLMLCISLVVLPALAQSDSDDAIKTMAGMLKGMHHYPSAKQKETLQGIIDNSNSTVADKTLASSIIRLQHTATAEDKEKLTQLMKDDSASANARSLADIIIHINHEPRPADQPTLDKLSQ